LTVTYFTTHIHIDRGRTYSVACLRTKLCKIAAVSFESSSLYIAQSSCHTLCIFDAVQIQEILATRKSDLKTYWLQSLIWSDTTSGSKQ